MQKLLGLLFILISLMIVFSCSDEPEADFHEVEIGDEWVSIELDEAPHYIDGENAFLNTLYQELKYPALARETGIEGIVLISYIIEPTGTVEVIEITEDIGAGCGLAAKLAVQSATTGQSYSPGLLNGQAVRVKKSLPIKFKLEG